jgi:hypothetical protein
LGRGQGMWKYLPHDEQVKGLPGGEVDFTVIIEK